MTVSPETRNPRDAAREMYRQGQALDAIAQALNVSVVSLLRWRKQDASKGRFWEGPKVNGGTDPDKGEFSREQPDLRGILRNQLETYLAELVAEATRASKKDDPRPTYEDRMLKVCRIIETLSPGGDDLSPQLAAMKAFATFCVRRLPESEMAPVRKAVRLFLDDLKARHQ